MSQWWTDMLQNLTLSVLLVAVTVLAVRGR